MPILSPYSDKKLLIIDDIPEMRSALRGQVGDLGFEKVSVAGSVRDALEQFKQNRFDVILCDYNLGAATDGQQFLEFLRTKRIISRATLFIMITAEQGYERVVTAAECLPDDYMLKPFTADTLSARIERLMDKKVRLAKVDAMQDRGRWADVVVACDEIIAARDRYLVDALRIKGNALLMAGRHDEAADFYRSALVQRPLPWAKLGLARALHQRGDGGEAKQLLGEVVAESPQLLAAHDLLGQIHLAEGNAGAALEVLDNACRVSPHSLTRHRAIAAVAERTADFARVEQAMNLVLEKTRNSPLRDPADYARLGGALTELGEPAKAVAIIAEARQSFKEAADDPHLAAVEAVAHARSGNAEAAQQALDRALRIDIAHLPGDTAVVLARACLVAGRNEAAEKLFKSAMQNNPDSETLRAQVVDVMTRHGIGERATQVVAESASEIIQLNNEAVRRGKAGELDAAARILADAARRLPSNLQIVANAAFALLVDIYTNGPDAQKLRDALAFQKSIQARNAAYPKLAEIADLLAKIRARHGQASPQ